MSVFHRTAVAGRLHRRRNDATSAPAFYVSPAGSDANDGSLAAPWRTIGFAVQQLGAGDTLYVRGGVYNDEHEFSWTCPGTKEAPVTVRNYPGETPIIDGSQPEFRDGSPEAPNSAWEVHDEGKSIYRSVNTFSSAASANGGSIMIGDTLYMLAVLTTRTTPLHSIVVTGYDYLSSDIHNHSAENVEGYNGRYFGPSYWWDPGDSRIYIRLIPPTAECTHGTAASDFFKPEYDFSRILTNTDPRENKLFICATGANGRFMLMSGNYAVFDGLEFRHYAWTFRATGTGHHYKNMKIYGSRSAFGGAAGIGHTFENLDIRMFIPPWISRTDVKGHEQPLIRLRTQGIGFGSQAENMTVLNCFFETFDGMLVTSSSQPTHGLTVKNCTFYKCDDDGIQLGTRCTNTEFAYNKIITSAGAGHHGTGQADEPNKWFHHNIYDNRAPMLITRYDPEGIRANTDQGWRGLNIVPTHTGETAGADPWKFYNNTIIVRDPWGLELSLGRWRQREEDYPDFPHELYNNILVQEFENTTTTMYCTRHALTYDGGEVYDGNCWALLSGAFMWLQAKNEAQTNKNFNTIVDLHADAYWDLTKINYAPGWEASGTQVDPDLGDDWLPQTAGMLEGGNGIPNPVDLSGKGWPGYDGNYRGAIPPGGSHTTIGSTIQINDVPMPP
jgi:hypothetical protein